MSAVNAHRDETIESPSLAEGRSFYKEDRPRRIDLTISFFGDEDSDDTCGDQLLETLSSDWSER
jgi:hypothetical protein